MVIQNSDVVLDVFWRLIFDKFEGENGDKEKDGRILDDSGGIWMILEVSGCYWRNLYDSGGIWMILEESGGFWMHLL